MNCFKLDKSNIFQIKDLYNRFMETALKDYGFESEPLNFDSFKNSIIKNINRGFLLKNGEETSGFLIYTDNLTDAIELTLVLSDTAEGEKTLLTNFTEYIKTNFKNKVISYPLLSNNRKIEESLTNLNYRFVEESILETKKFYEFNPNLPDTYELTVWNEKFLTPVTKIVQSTFSKSQDANFDPRFLTFAGCKKILQQITLGILGDFLPDITSVILYKNEPVGVCFVNLTNEQTANIPLLAVNEQYQHKKFGQILVKNSISKLYNEIKNKNLPVNKINVTCNGDNISAMKTYTNSGFVKSEEYKHFYLKI